MGKDTVAGGVLVRKNFEEGRRKEGREGSGPSRGLYSVL